VVFPFIHYPLSTHTQPTMSTTVPVSTDSAFDSILEPFSVNRSQLRDLLEDTGAVLAGGAVTHYLSKRSEPLPDSSDLDFWVYDPYLKENCESKQCTSQPSTSGFANIFHSKVFRQLVVARFLNTFSGFSAENMSGKGQSGYSDFEGFQAKQGNHISIHWLKNTYTKRMINVIFSSLPPWQTVKLFDIPLNRAMVFVNNAGLQCQYSNTITTDFEDGKLTLPESKTIARIQKYCERYGLTVRI
jgi:hypothetical protein